MAETEARLPLFLAAEGASVGEIGLVAGLYPAVWGICQLVTGPLSDRCGRKWLIVSGMVLQGIALVAIALTTINMFGGFAVTQRMLQMFRK